jgi:uncharacterized protein (DUF433 family)/uncharacterized protein YcgL (UPF0745 family)
VIQADNIISFEPREVAAYSYAEAARLLGVPASTVRAWKKGQDYIYQGRRQRFSEPIPSKLLQGLSYNDLVEVFVLRALRTKHNFSLGYIRSALKEAQRAFDIDRLFLHEAFRIDPKGREFFLSRIDDYASLSGTAQLSMKMALEAYLERLEYGPDHLAVDFYPVIPKLGLTAPKLISVNATIAFGRPAVKRLGIRTSAISSRIDAGEDRETVIQDYRLTPAEFDQAIYLEAA